MATTAQDPESEREQILAHAKMLLEQFAENELKHERDPSPVLHIASDHDSVHVVSPQDPIATPADTVDTHASTETVDANTQISSCEPISTFSPSSLSPSSPPSPSASSSSSSSSSSSHSSSSCSSSSSTSSSSSSSLSSSSSSSSSASSSSTSSSSSSSSVTSSSTATSSIVSPSGARLTRMESAPSLMLMRERANVSATLQTEQTRSDQELTTLEQFILRAESGDTTCTELQTHVQAENKLMLALATSLGSLPSFATKDRGTMKLAGPAKLKLGTAIAEHIRHTHDHVLGPSARKLTALVKELKHSTSDIRKAIKPLRNALIASRREVMNSWTAYERAVTERFNAQEQGAETVAKVDPYLRCRQFELETIKQAQVRQNAFTDIQNLASDVGHLEARRVDSLRTILLENLEAQREMQLEALKETEAAIQAISAVDQKSDMSSFVAESGLTVKKSLLGNLDQDFFYRLYRFEVHRQGMVARLGGLLGRSWKNVFCAVSRTGYFHCFEDSMAVSPSLTIRLFDCLAAPAPSVHALAFEIEQPNYSVFSLTGNPVKFYFKAETAQEVYEWVLALMVYCRRKEQ